MDFVFEFCEQKSRANKSKHGIDFVEAQALWLDEELVEVKARTEDECVFRPISTADSDPSRPLIPA